jgi:hypothetical protein
MSHTRIYRVGDRYFAGRAGANLEAQTRANITDQTVEVKTCILDHFSPTDLAVRLLNDPGQLPEFRTLRYIRPRREVPPISAQRKTA